MESLAAPSLTWTPGMDVGACRLVREIARGGMGEIWLAHQRGMADYERLVVVKRVLADAEQDASFVTLFLDEARIASQLHHPNVVQVFELGEQAGSYYLVMEYLEGQNLARVAKRVLQQGPFPEVLAVEIISAAARGLGYAHRRKDAAGVPMRIVHRDVSPANLFVTYDGQVKVLDFGIAKSAGRLSRTQAGMVRGKLKYMSPEQALSEPVEASSDVFSLGVVLFELVTGTRFHGDLEEPAILRRLASGQLPRAAAFDGVDPGLGAILARMLVTAPEHRLADGQAVHEALEGWLRTARRTDSTASLEVTMGECFREERAQHSELKRAPVLPLLSAPGSNSLPNGSPRAPRKRPAGPAVLAVGGVLFVALLGLNAWGLLRAPAATSDAPASVVLAAPVVAAPVPQPAPVVPAPVPVVPAPVVPAPLVEAPAVVADAGAAVPARVASGRLTLETDPWTHVALGKRPLGDTPLVEYSLPAGHHRLHLVNEADGIDMWIVVDVRADQTTVKKLSL